jgi:hypothetical protein
VLPAALSQKFTADGLLFSGRGLIRGWSIIETGGTDPGVAVLYDAAVSGDTAKPVAFPYTAKSTSDTKGLFTSGLAVERGCYVDLTLTGSLVVWYNTETRAGSLAAVFSDGTMDLSELGLEQLLRKLAAQVA